MPVTHGLIRGCSELGTGSVGAALFGRWKGRHRCSAVWKMERAASVQRCLEDGKGGVGAALCVQRPQLAAQRWAAWHGSADKPCRSSQHGLCR
eukprot:354718-Chlamydomonas_euryale.AAC.7